MRILIATPSLVPNDAVSNDVLQQSRQLSAHGFKVKIFSEHCHESLLSINSSRFDFESDLRDRRNLLIYHHSVFWAIGDSMLSLMRCKLLFKYHNITPPQYFAFDRHRVHLTTEGRAQSARFIQSGKVSLFVGDSQFNTEELVRAGAPRNHTQVIAPFNRIHDYEEVVPSPELISALTDEVKHVLFVGRVAPNKGHLHLLRTIQRYVAYYGKKIHLHIVGGLSPGDRPYLQQIEDEIQTLKLLGLISFHDKITFEELAAFYRGCDAFLLLSEHEGFCVPILEAQYNALPIVAWDQSAVGETLGQGQLLFKGLNYGEYAAALHQIFISPSLKDELIKNGKININRFEAPRLLEQTLEAIHAIKT